MGERLFEANGQDNDNDFRRKNHPDTAKENKRKPSDHVISPRYCSGDESCNWFERNPQRESGGSSDSLFTTNKSNERERRYTSSTDEGALVIDDRPAKSDEIDQSNTALARNEIGEYWTPAREKGNVRNNPEKTIWLTSDPPALVEEDDGWKLLPNSTNDNTIRMKRTGAAKNTDIIITNMKAVFPESDGKYKTYKTKDLKFSCDSTDGSMRIKLERVINDKVDETKKRNNVIDDEVSITKKNDNYSSVDTDTEYFSASSMISDSGLNDEDDDIELHENNEIALAEIEELIQNEAMIIAMIKECGHTNEEMTEMKIERESTMLRITLSMHGYNNHLGYKRIGKAERMIALLRRCLYPKRDVIRWID